MLGWLCQRREGIMATEFDKIVKHAAAISGSDVRKYYSDYDDPPSDEAVAKAIKGIQGEVSDQLAYAMANTKLLVSIKQSLAAIAICTGIIAFVVVRFAWANNFWN